MTASISTHWLAKLIGFQARTLEVDDNSVLADSSLKIGLSEQATVPTLSEGTLFSSLKIGEHIFKGLPKKTAGQFLITSHRAWYLARYDKVKEFHNKASRYMTATFVRSSKFEKLQQFAQNVKDTYRATPKASLLLPSNIQQSFEYIDHIINNSGNLLEEARTDFVKAEAQRYTKLFDTVESNPLTDKQREACVTDNDSNLVLAGAGTGKTSVMVGKAGYLVESGKAKPDEILMLAFGNKAAKELQERIEEKLGDTKIKASTFHAVGKSIIAKIEGKQPSVSELATDDKLRDKYVDDVLTELLEQTEYERKAVTYFEKYLYPDANPFDFKTKGEYFEYLEENDIRSLKGELVKSYGELLIANYLFVHGIEYQYEAKYKISTQNADFQQYKPDFYLVEQDIYIEHYGIDRDKNTAPFIDSTKYNRDIEWKRKTHDENETACLETFHYQKQEGNLLDKLAEQLNKHNVEIEPIADKAILDTLKEAGKVSILARLLSSLLANVKNSCQTVKQAIDIAQQASNSAQAMAALDLLLPILERYEGALDSQGEIDFNDMIHNATAYVNEGKFVPKWKYILIDEFQDIASSRANLVKALREDAENCSLFCVGDDWQSIYRFTGSDLNYTTEFEQEFGYFSITKLDKTYRFNNSICDVATKFVTQNPIQQKKHLITNDRVSASAVSVLRVKGSSDIAHIDRTLANISTLSKKPLSVYVISRYKYLVDKGELSAIARKYPNLSVSPISMHGSKGKEADYVIVIGLEKGKSGFPSEKVTHPLLELYLPPEESFLNAEERRLFYVAITRAKKRVYLVADMSRASSFMTELLKKGEYDLCLDEFDTPIEQIEYEAISCPECEIGTLTIRTNGNSNQKFVGCSNYKRCTHTESCCPRCDTIMASKGRFRVCISCDWKIPMCTACNGEMRKRPSTGHWGCSNYRGKDSFPTCTNQENRIEF